MNLILFIAGLFIIFSIPFWSFIFLLIVLKLFFVNISFRISSLYSISNVEINIGNEYLTLFIHIDNIRFVLTWSRIRIVFTNFLISLQLNQIEIEELPKFPFENNINDLPFIKEKLNEILKGKMYTNNKDSNLVRRGEIENLNDILNTKRLNWYDYILRIVLNFIDIYIQSIKLIVKFKTNNFYYSISSRKIIIGIAKSPNIKTEINLLGGIYNFELIEYRRKSIINEKKIWRKNHIFNLDNNEITNEYYYYKILYLPSSVFKIKFSNGFTSHPKTLSLWNTINIAFESQNLISDICTKSLNNIFQFIINLISFFKKFESNKLNIKLFNTGNKTNENMVQTIEQYIINVLNSTIKKIIIKFFHIRISLNSDNFIFKHMEIMSNGLEFNRNASLYIGNDYNNLNLHLLNSELKISFSELKISQFKNQSYIPMCEVPGYSITVKQNINYKNRTQTAEISTIVSSKLENVNASLKTTNLDKIIETIITIIDGIELIELTLKQNLISKTKFEKDLIDSTNYDFTFKNIRIILYSKDFTIFTRNISLKLTMNKIKNKEKEISLIFSPINLSFSHNENNNSIINNYFTGHCLLEDFKIQLKDNRKEKKIHLIFGNSLAYAHDFHLLYIMKFISEIIGSIFEQGILQKINNNNKKKKKERKTEIKLLWVKLEIIHYLNKIDIIYGKLENFELLVGDHLLMPYFKSYYCSTIKDNFFEFCELEHFIIEFREKENLINIIFDDIKINACTPLVARPIHQFSTFYIFFPVWLDYYLFTQFIIDDETEIELFKTERSKTSKVKITFSKIQVDINDSPITTAAILQANKNDLKIASLKSDYQVIQYLKNIKKNLLTVKLSSFTIDCESDKIVTDNLNNDINYGYYYEKILSNSSVKLIFGEIDVELEKNEILSLNNFTIFSSSKTEKLNYNPYKSKKYCILFDEYYIFYNKVYSDEIRDSECIITIDGLKFDFHDVLVFDKTLNFTFKAVKVCTGLPIRQFTTFFLRDSKMKVSNSNFNLIVSNLNGNITSVDPITKEVYNKLDIKIAIFLLSTNSKMEYHIIKKNILELSLHYFVFGFTPSQKTGFPLLILPLAEANFDNIKNIIRVNIPTDISNKTSYSLLFSGIYNAQLNKLVMDTKSLTVFINFKYINTFFKIFKIFWAKTESIRLNLTKKNEKVEKIKTHFSRRISYNNQLSFNSKLQKFKRQSALENSLIKIDYINNNKDNLNNENNEIDIEQKLMISLFDLKIIYLLEFKESYENIFKFHPFVKEHGFFGYIFRLYSASMRLHKKKVQNNIKANLDFLTISYLDDDNYSDEAFFINDREIQIKEFYNLKNLQNFNEFMELERSNTFKLINHNSRENFELNNNNDINNKEKNEFQESENISNQKSIISKREKIGYNDLKFDNRHTFIKISNVTFHYKTVNSNTKKISLLIDTCKIAWNKFNKDVLQIIIQDILLLLDSILKKKKNKDKQKKYLSPTKSILTEEIEEIEDSLLSETNELNKLNGQLNFLFEIKNIQITVQNEVKNSILLLLTKEPITLEISKFLFENNVKDFSIEIICNYLLIYSAPKNRNDGIYWMGDRRENKYYLNEDNFRKIIETPKIRFKVSQRVENIGNQNYNVYSFDEIMVDKIKGDFESSSFTDFLNIVQLLIFDRGFSFSEEKGNEDMNLKEMTLFKQSDLENKIKSVSNSKILKLNSILKSEISFNLGEVILNLCNEGKTLVQFLMLNFDGNHQIFEDKSSETHINVRNIRMRNIENGGNELILSPLYIDRSGELEDKMNIITFTKKDSYIKLETESLWYVIDYLEFSFRPISINISKNQIMFILNFFFGLKNENDEKKEKVDEKELPIYFKHFQINKTEILLNFEYGEGHPLNIPRTKLKFGKFDKQEKFYPMGIMIDRFISHSKKQCIKNVCAIISGLFSSTEYSPYEKKKKKEMADQAQRKLLFGD